MHYAIMHSEIAFGTIWGHKSILIASTDAIIIPVIEHYGAASLIQGRHLGHFASPFTQLCYMLNVNGALMGTLAIKCGKALKACDMYWYIRIRSSPEIRYIITFDRCRPLSRQFAVAEAVFKCKSTCGAKEGQVGKFLPTKYLWRFSELYIEWDW